MVTLAVVPTGSKSAVLDSASGGGVPCTATVWPTCAPSTSLTVTRALPATPAGRRKVWPFTEAASTPGRLDVTV